MENYNLILLKRALEKEKEEIEKELKSLRDFPKIKIIDIKHLEDKEIRVYGKIISPHQDVLENYLKPESVVDLYYDRNKILEKCIIEDVENTYVVLSGKHISDNSNPQALLNKIVQIRNISPIFIIEEEIEFLEVFNDKKFANYYKLLFPALYEKYEIIKRYVISLNKEFNSEIQETKPYHISVRGLNKNQVLAINRSISVIEKEGFDFHLIWGPPGTGKTTVISKLCEELYSKGKKAIITSHTNVAVDNVLERLISNVKLKPEEVVRVGIVGKISKTCKVYQKDKLEDRDLENVRFLFATLSYVFLKRSMLNDKFDIIIIDEASMAPPAMVLGAITIPKNCKFLMIGDPKQLGPVFRSETGKNLDSIFDHLLHNYPNKSTMLTIQYRFSEKIMKVVNELFYENKLLCGLKSQLTFNVKDGKLKIQDNKLKEVFSDNPLIWINTSSLDSRHEWTKPSHEGGSRSAYNEYEAALVTVVIKYLIDYLRINPNEISVITPFKKQATIIKKLVKKLLKSKIECLNLEKIDKDIDPLQSKTVDSFQGRESDIVIFNLVLSGGGNLRNKSLEDPRRINVAITRAKKKVIIMGDTLLRRDIYLIKNLYECFKKYGGRIIEVSEIKDSEFKNLLNEYKRRCSQMFNSKNTKEKKKQNNVLDIQKEYKERPENLIKLIEEENVRMKENICKVLNRSQKYRLFEKRLKMQNIKFKIIIRNGERVYVLFCNKKKFEEIKRNWRWLDINSERGFKKYKV